MGGPLICPVGGPPIRAAGARPGTLIYGVRGESATMPVTVADAALSVCNADRRMTFHFGNVHISAGPQLFVGVDLTVDGTAARGVASGTLTPMWFYKDPEMTLADSCGHLLDAAQAASDHAIDTEADSVFDLWRSIHAAVDHWAADRANQPPLLWNYAVSLIEQAAIDAFCRATDTSFPAAVHENTLGIDLGWWYDELAGVEPTDLLPDAPIGEAAVRHTVGLSDPLTPADLAPEDRLDDGLPQTLSEYVEDQGITHFKVKLAADSNDADRLRRIAAVVEDRVGDDYVVTLDANEQYDDVAQFRDHWQRLRDDDRLTTLIENVQYVEQPLPRGVALSEATGDAFAAWDDRPPVIIDESDDRPRTCKTALERGYAGTSHKNCKGVLTSIANGCLIEHYDRRYDQQYVLSGEDLSTLPPVELQEDLAVAATLGLRSIERNGHHYYRGLSMFPAAVQTAVHDAHPDLFRRHEDGFVTLDIADGTIDLGSVVAAPFGHDVDVDPTRFIPVDEWTVASISE